MSRKRVKRRNAYIESLLRDEKLQPKVVEVHPPMVAKITEEKVESEELKEIPTEEDESEQSQDSNQEDENESDEESGDDSKPKRGRKKK